MLISWIKDYYAIDNVFSYKQHLEFYDTFEGDKLTIYENQYKI